MSWLNGPALVKVSMICMSLDIRNEHNVSGGDVEVVGILDSFNAGVHVCEPLMSSSYPGLL